MESSAYLKPAYSNQGSSLLYWECPQTSHISYFRNMEQRVKKMFLNAFAQKANYYVTSLFTSSQSNIVQNICTKHKSDFSALGLAERTAQYIWNFYKSIYSGQYSRGTRKYFFW